MESTELTKEIIESFDMPSRTYKPDWDDLGVAYTLPCGIELKGLTVCLNEPCDLDHLEGMDGAISIHTKEELEALYDMSLEEIEEVKD